MNGPPSQGNGPRRFRRRQSNACDRMHHQEGNGGYKGQLKTLTIRADIDIVPNTAKNSDSQPYFRVLTKGYEISAGWVRKGETPGNEYVSLSLAAPEFRPRKLTPNLGSAVGQDDNDVFAVIWNPRRLTAAFASAPRAARRLLQEPQAHGWVAKTLTLGFRQSSAVSRALTLAAGIRAALSRPEPERRGLTWMTMPRARPMRRRAAPFSRRFRPRTMSASRREPSSACVGPVADRASASTAAMSATTSPTSMPGRSRALGRKTHQEHPQDLRTDARSCRPRQGHHALQHPTHIATELRKRGVALAEVAGFLGHSSGYRTTERYAKYGPDHLSEAVRAIDAYFTDLARPAPLPQINSGTVRASCVLAGGQKVVEQRGIEPRTSTLRMSTSGRFHEAAAGRAAWLAG
jgi:uncharacterized protein (DUF736 family)